MVSGMALILVRGMDFVVSLLPAQYSLCVSIVSVIVLLFFWRVMTLHFWLQSRYT